MTLSKRYRPFVPTLAVALSIAAGAAQAQGLFEPRRVPLCSLEEEMPLPQGVVNQILGREDFDFLLRYSADNCPEVALLLSDSATAALGTGALPALEPENEGPRRVPLCTLEAELPLSPSVLAAILAREDFDDLLLYSSENCPEVALLLTDSATATIPEDDGPFQDPDVDREGPEDRRDPPVPDDEPGDDEEPTDEEPTDEEPTDEEPTDEETDDEEEEEEEEPPKGDGRPPVFSPEPA
jgi:hypothetical protein